MKKMTYALMIVLLMIVQSSLCRAEPQNNNAGRKIVAIWHFNEGTGNIAHGRVHGVIYGASWVDGKIGKALSFDGNEDYVNFGDHDSLDFGTGDFSIAVWVRVADYTPDQWEDEIVFKFDFTVPRHGYLLGVRGSNDPIRQRRVFAILGLGERDGIHIFGPVITDNQWHHVVLTVHRVGCAKLYVDGENAVSKDISGYSSQDESNTIPFTIGGITPGRIRRRTLNGIIDELYIYNRALSANEVNRLYRTTLRRG